MLLTHISGLAVGVESPSVALGASALLAIRRRWPDFQPLASMPSQLVAVIGGAAGALPPVVAYAAATGTMAIEPWILFAIIFIWTPPHFWALALVKAADYERAGVPMMPNAKGPDRTRTEILFYSLALAPLGVAPWLMGFASVVYGVVSIIGGGAMIAYAVNVYRVREGAAGDKAAMKLFGVSILYLFALFGLLVIERSIPVLARMIGWSA
jgi:protoheme IX farnesyltransferase